MRKFKKIIVALSLVFLFTLNTMETSTTEVTAVENNSVQIIFHGLIEGEH